MLVRSLLASRARRLSPSRHAFRVRLAVHVLASLAVSCARPPRAELAHEVAFASSLAPAPPAVGPATLAVRLSDAGGQPVRGARLRVQADMTHPGMRPVLAAAEERGDGLYEARFAFTMAGDWAVTVSGELADGRRVDHRLDVPGVRAAP